MDRLAEFKKTYFEECADLLIVAESQLIAVSNGGGDDDSLNAIFRAVHSIKGGAGAFGFDRLVRYAHSFESLLDLLRRGDVQMTRAGQDLLLRALDVLNDLVGEAREGLTVEEERVQAAGAALDHWAQTGEAQHLDIEPRDRAVDHPEVEPTTYDEDEFGGLFVPPPVAAPSPPAGAQRYRISFIPSTDMLRKANEPLLLLRELSRLGRAEVQADLSRLPALEAMDPDAAYLSWRIDLETDAGLDVVNEVFEFVVDDCQLEIAPLTGGVVAGASPPSASMGSAHLDETPAAASSALVAQPSAKTPAPAAVPASPVAPVAAPAAAAGRPANGDAGGFHPGGGPAGAGGAQAATSIRVDLEKVDRLVNMVGEIVITQTMLAQQMSSLQLDKYPELIMGLEQMAQHTRELQESVMSIRAQPVKSVFQRMPRLVREVAAACGKEVRLITVGENTEVDKTVIEQLSDPLTHMVRNAVDHGIETSEDRERAGKPREGTILLSAEHRGGRIVIGVADDGGGINAEAVRRKAIENGLIAADVQLSEEECYNLLFMPGFSTAKTVSNISGRGVGMDVVKRNIQDLGGRIHVESELGVGSHFTLSLPLTLAVLDGMIVTVGGERYVVPLTSIVESLRPLPKDVSSLVNAGDVLSIRGEYVRMLYLHKVFDIPNAIGDPTKGLVVLVEVEGREKVGLVVDELLGQQQIVVKSLESNYQHIEGVAAATILGDGRVALILDVAGLCLMGGVGGRPGRGDHHHHAHA